MLDEVVIDTHCFAAQIAFYPRGSVLSKQSRERGLPFGEFFPCIHLIVQCSRHMIVWNVIAISFTHTIIIDILYVEKRLDAERDPNRDDMICEHEFHAARILVLCPKSFMS
jgi:hypothetical protein